MHTPWLTLPCPAHQILSKAVAYIQQNELTKWIKVVYVYEDLNDPIIRVLAENLRVIDRCFPKVPSFFRFLSFICVCPIWVYHIFSSVRVILSACGAARLLSMARSPRWRPAV
jgi:hypothetical protein